MKCPGFVRVRGCTCPSIVVCVDALDKVGSVAFQVLSSVWKGLPQVKVNRWRVVSETLVVVNYLWCKL